MEKLFLPSSSNTFLGVECRTMQASREEVSTDDLLSRHIFDPPMFPGRTLVAKFFFEFPQNQCESVVWQRKLSDAIDGVHRLGCEHQTKLRQRQAAEGKVPTKKYVGAATARCGEIRAYRNPQGHGIKVVHEPNEGAHHVELCYDLDASAPAMTRSDKNEIKFKLVQLFASLSLHDCPTDLISGRP